MQALKATGQAQLDALSDKLLNTSQNIGNLRGQMQKYLAGSIIQRATSA